MITVSSLREFKAKQEKITMLTCYDATFAFLLDHCGVEILLVGDSLGMVIQGHTSTLPVQLQDICYHTACVARATKEALILADLPFGSYESNKEQAIAAATQLMKAGANMVKLEGGSYQADTVAFLYERGIPTAGHLGLTPQSFNTLGGYKVQGKTDQDSERLLQDAKVLDQAGVNLIILECITQQLAAKITQTVSQAATIGIGAGKYCDGQVLVLHDILGLQQRNLSFVKNFMQGKTEIKEAIYAYIKEVKKGIFPDEHHSFS